MEGFTKHVFQVSYLARKAQLALSHSLDKTFTEMVSVISGVMNIPSHPLDLANANQIYSSDLVGLRGKEERTNTECAYEQFVNVPHNFYWFHQFMMLVANVIFVNTSLFLVTIS